MKKFLSLFAFLAFFCGQSPASTSVQFCTDQFTGQMINKPITIAPSQNKLFATNHLLFAGFSITLTPVNGCATTNLIAGAYDCTIQGISQIFTIWVPPTNVTILAADWIITPTNQPNSTGSAFAMAASDARYESKAGNPPGAASQVLSTDGNGSNYWATANANISGDLTIDSSGVATLANSSAARTHLGLGTAATRDAGASPNQVLLLDNLGAITVDNGANLSGNLLFNGVGGTADFAVGALFDGQATFNGGMVGAAGGLTGLNAGALASGTIPFARLPAGVGLTNGFIGGEIVTNVLNQNALLLANTNALANGLLRRTDTNAFANALARLASQNFFAASNNFNDYLYLTSPLGNTYGLGSDPVTGLLTLNDDQAARVLTLDKAGDMIDSGTFTTRSLASDLIHVTGVTGTNFGLAGATLALVYTTISNSPTLTPGHDQGEITDNTNFISFFTTNVIKFAPNWTMISSNLSPFSGISPTLLHIAPGYYDPVANTFSAVAVDTANGLSCTAVKLLTFDQNLNRTANHDLSAGIADGFDGSGIALDAPDNLLWGSSYYSGSKKLYKFDATTFAYLGFVTIDRAVTNLQGIAYRKGLLTCSSDLQATIYDITTDGHVVGAVNFLSGYDVNVNGTAEGIYWYSPAGGAPDQLMLSFEVAGGSAAYFMKLQTNLLQSIGFDSPITNNIATQVNGWLRSTGQVSFTSTNHPFTDYTLDVAIAFNTRHAQIWHCYDQALNYAASLDITAGLINLGFNLNRGNGGAENLEDSGNDGFAVRYIAGGSGSGSLQILGKNSSGGAMSGGSIFKTDGSVQFTNTGTFAAAAGTVPLSVLGAASQTADLFDVKSNAVKVAWIDNTGAFAGNSGGLTNLPVRPFYSDIGVYSNNAASETIVATNATGVPANLFANNGDHATYWFRGNTTNGSRTITLKLAIGSAVNTVINGAAFGANSIVELQADLKRTNSAGGTLYVKLTRGASGSTVNELYFPVAPTWTSDTPIAISALVTTGVAGDIYFNSADAVYYKAGPFIQ